MATEPNTNGSTTNNGSYRPPLTDKQFDLLLNRLTDNAYSLRRDLARFVMDPRRNIEDEIGTPRLGEPIEPELLWQLYERDPIANKAVRLIPEEIWKVTPSVYEVEEGEDSTPFEEAIDDLPKQLATGMGAPSFFQDNEGCSVNEELMNGEIAARLGRYGVVLLGLDDDKPLSEPVEGFEETNSGVAEITVTRDDNGKVTNRKINVPETKQRYQLKINQRKTAGRQLHYLRVFPEYLAPIGSLESNKSSPRYGLPNYYNLSFLNPLSVGGTFGIDGALGSVERVHWSRVIHLTPNSVSNKAFGTPPLYPIFDIIHALRKVYGGSGEGYWKAVIAILALVTHPQLGGDVDIRGGEQKLKDEMEKLVNSLERYGVFTGFDLKTVAPTLVDPTPYKEMFIEAVCIFLDIPKRIFQGSERGEMSSAQDTGEWDKRLIGWRYNKTTPRTLVPFYDRLIQVGVLPEPEAKQNEKPEAAPNPKASTPPSKTAAENAKRFVSMMSKYGHGNYDIKKTRGGLLVVNKANDGTETPKKFISNSGFSAFWPEPVTMTPEKEANVALVKTQALTTFLSGGGEQGMTLQRFYTEVWGMEEEEAQTVVSEVEDQLAQEEEKNQALADEQGLEVAPPPGFVNPELEKQKAASGTPSPNGAGGFPPSKGQGSFPPKGGAPASDRRAGAKPGSKPPPNFGQQGNKDEPTQQKP